jgi:hypothetical protein
MARTAAARPPTPAIPAREHAGADTGPSGSAFTTDAGSLSEIDSAVGVGGK